MIPDDVTHGQDLVCSYPACRDSGVKFRYCLFCRVPVARRNFRLRHNHEAEAARGVNENVNVPNTISVAKRRQNGIDESNMISTCSESDLRKQQIMQESQTQHKYAKKPPADADSRELGDFVPLTIRISSGSATPVNDDATRVAEARAFKDDDQDIDVPERSDRDRNKKRSKTCSSEKKHRKRDHKNKRKRSKREPTDVDELVRDEPAEETAKAVTNGGIHCTSTVNPRSTKRKRRSREKNDFTLVEDSYSSSRAATAGKGDEKQSREGDERESKGPKKFSNRRVMVWADLLGKRPPSEEDEHMSRWLMNVMAASDLGVPLKCEGEVSSSRSSLTPDEFGSDEDHVSA
jgi:hypothetical protein